MRLKRKVLRQVMLLLRNIESEEVNLKDLVPVYRDGSFAGFTLEVVAKEKPKLELVKDEKDED